MIAMIVVGIVLIPGVAFWEVGFAKRPVLAGRLLKNRTLMIAAWIGFFDFVRNTLLRACDCAYGSALQFSYYLTTTYLYSFITITKPW